MDTTDRKGPNMVLAVTKYRRQEGSRFPALLAGLSQSDRTLRTLFRDRDTCPERRASGRFKRWFRGLATLP